MDYDHSFLIPKDEEQTGRQSGPVCDFSQCSRRRMTFSTIIFLYAFASIGSLAYYSLLKDEFKLDPAELNAYNTFVSLLFIFKPLYGFITDSCYIMGRRRQPYVIICGLMAAGLWVCMSYLAHSAIVATLLMFLINGMLGIINSVSQALVVEDAQGKKARGVDEPQDLLYSENKAVSNVSLFFMVDSVGLLLSSYLSGFLVSIFPTRGVFLLSAIVPTLISLVGFIFTEKRVIPKPKCQPRPAQPAVASTNNPADTAAAPASTEVASKKDLPAEPSETKATRLSWRHQLRRVLRFIRIRSILLPLIFIFLFTLTPSTYDAMMYFYMNELHFDYEFIGRMQLVSSAAMMLGIGLYYKWLYKHSFKSIVVYSTVLATVFGIVQVLQILRLNVKVGIPDTYLALSLDLITNSLAELQTMPVLVLACKLCPKHLEAAIYESIMGIKNTGFFLSYRMGGLFTFLLGITATNFDNLWILSLLSTAFPMITLVLLLFVPIKTNYQEEFELLEKKMKARDDERDSLIPQKYLQRESFTARYYADVTNTILSR